jgi:hypothetical protein
VASQPRWTELADRLIRLGGDDVIAIYDEDLDQLLSEGRVWPVEGLELRERGSALFRAAAAALYQSLSAEEPGTARLVTGWALSRDRLWRQHCWVVRDERVLEPMAQRLVYYGIALTPERAQAFCWTNR